MSMYIPESNPEGVRNINMMERWLSMIAGGAFITWGLRHSGLRGLWMTLLGGYMAQRGLSGHCEVFRALGFNTAGDLSRMHGYSNNTTQQEPQYGMQANQAEGERKPRRKSARVGTTPGPAKGDRETVEQDLQSKSQASGL
jgi:hypothetical protein